MTENGSATSRELGRPHPEERACASASAESNARARVSKDEDERLSAPSCFETHRSAPSLWKRLRSSCCDAPQHEGAGEWCILAKRTQRILFGSSPQSGDP
jgi:hypothetical protein